MPVIDERGFQELLDEKKGFASLYTPEWNLSDEKDLGVVLLKIFTHIQEEITSRLNRVPEKNFAAFLDMLGLGLTSVQQVQPAKAPVTFYLAEGTPEGVFVPAGTYVATAETEEHESLTFETENGFFATSATIKEIYSVDPKKDVILNYPDALTAEREFKIFDDEKENLQEHVLYMGHDTLFCLKGNATIKLKFTFVSGGMEDLADSTWEYWGEDEKIPERFAESIDVSTGEVTLTPEREIKEKKINGITSHWIHCRSKRVTDKTVVSKIQICGVASEEIKPDLGFYKYIPLDLTREFYPFGTQPRLLDAFYIASQEVFSKKNGTITITLKRRGDAPVPGPDEGTQLLWEYWNGVSWQPLPVNNNTIDNFRLKKINDDCEGELTFDCPKDISEFEVNGQKNYWIRVVLIKGDYGKEKLMQKEPYLFSIDDGDSESTLDQGNISEGLKNGFKDKNIIFTENIIITKKNDDEWVITDEEEKNTYYIRIADGKLKIYGKAVWSITPNFNPPLISDINIKYFLKEEINLQHCLAHNNLEYRGFTEKSRGEGDAGFKPFIPLPEKHPTIYMGFKDALKKGNISIFVSLVEKIQSVDAIRKIKWTYWSKAPDLSGGVEGMGIGTELLFENSSGGKPVTETAVVGSDSDFRYTRDIRILKRTHLEVSDNTEYLTRSGTLEFIGSSEQLKTSKFGKECCWLMGTLDRDLNEDFEPPLIRGIYPNTVWAENAETTRDEIIGSGDGEGNRSYNVVKSPIISPEIWIREMISKDEGEALSGGDIQEIKDDAGGIMETWVRWNAVDDFSDSDSRSRHCTLDNAMGEVLFGDGVAGRIPPIGKNNIKVNYKSGGGIKGNVAKGEISIIKTTVAGVDHVINHEPSEGGSDAEPLEAFLKRGPHRIKHRDRAVTEEDFERLAMTASSHIARTNCFIANNILKVIIVPTGSEDKPIPSTGLLKKVKKYLLERSSNLIPPESIEVREPSYTEVRITVDAVPEFIDQAITLEKEMSERLKEFLHPLTGGPGKNGWEFGRDIHISDVYALLKSINGVDRVEKLMLNDSSGDLAVEEYRIVCSGEHRITMKLGG